MTSVFRRTGAVCAFAAASLVAAAAGAPERASAQEGLPTGAYQCRLPATLSAGTTRVVAVLDVLGPSRYSIKLDPAFGSGDGEGEYRFERSPRGEVKWLSGPLAGLYSTYEPAAFNPRVFQLWLGEPIKAFCRIG